MQAGLARGLVERGHDVVVITSCPHYNPPTNLAGRRDLGMSVLRPIATAREGQLRVVRCFVPRRSASPLRRVFHFAILHLLMLFSVALHARDRDVTIVVSPPLTLALVGMLARR